MVQPGKGRSLPSLCFAKGNTEYIGDTGCFVMQGVDSLGVGTLSGLVPVGPGEKYSLGCQGRTLRHYSHDWCGRGPGGNSQLPGGCRVGCGDVQLLNLMSYPLA
ncbi:hypothetical protein L1987_15027 [Smallanthus sonchifolius]|uniref:Uncharacterized protein n=1 Tax=Smallanthus sonchifolius TaxID=185202 RepID=A0ACB9J5G0_9ASTR|nr:hypothetical protein L1987_15027 [Smallanthus sonchifolius]